MRALTWMLALPLLATAPIAVAQTSCGTPPCTAAAPVELQFSISVFAPGTAPDGFPVSNWTGAGPIPTTVQETFYVDPSSATGVFATEQGPNGLVLGHVAESFNASNITLSANGQILEQSASGTFEFAGDRANDGGPGGSFFGGVSLPMGGGGADIFTSYGQAPPDWAAFLSTSAYIPDGVFTVSGAFGTLDGEVQGAAVASQVSVPEPGSLALCGLAAFGLLVMHRRRPALRAARK